VLAVAVVAAAVTGAVWTRNGRPLAGWAGLGLAWLLRRGRRTTLSEAPRAGSPVTGPGSEAPASGDVRPGARHRYHGRPGAPILPGGTELVEHDPGPGSTPFGVVRDRPGSTWVAVLPVRGRSFCLLDPDEQLQRLDAWRTVLAALARPGSPVSRLQWVQRSGPAGGRDRPHPPGVAAGTGCLGEEAAESARRSYRQLVDAVTPTAQRHDTWLALGVGRDRRAGGRSGPEVLAREVRFLGGQLRQAGLEPGAPLGRGALGELLGAGAMAVRESWSELQVDGSLHATYWVAEWPRVEVGPDFLVPLLMGGGRRSVSLVMTPVAPDRALREVRSARTADAADAQLRSRAGFLSSARRDREAEGVARREHELADGHAEYRFSAYVSVAADDGDGLAAACAELEQAGQAARLELRRLYGRQADAYTWTLPLGRGLR
jgi:hypothetical protein